MKLPAHVQAEVDRLVAEATGQSEPGPRMDLDGPAPGDLKPPRIPAIGLHAGAIDGTTPHHQPRLDEWGPK